MKVTVEGTLTPAVGGPGRGERVEVEVTDRVRGWVRAGAALVVAGSLRPEHRGARRAVAAAEVVAVEDAGESDDPGTAAPLVPPARNASRNEWAEYLRAKGVRFPDDRVAFDAGDRTAWAGRDDLIVIDQQASGGR